MAIEIHLPLLEEILDGWRPQLGEDYNAYRNHLYRMANFCFALHQVTAEDRQKVEIAACFHDLGIWSDGTVDYLPPSVALARQYLQQNGLAHWQVEIELMIDLHHKLRRVDLPQMPLVEAFRKADLVDLSLGMVTFGLPRDLIRAVKAQFPNQGFHKRLMKLAGQWFAKHPVSPPPFLKW